MPRRPARGTTAASRRRASAQVSQATGRTGAQNIANGGTGNDTFTDGEFVVYDATQERLESSGSTSGTFASAVHTHDHVADVFLFMGG